MALSSAFVEAGLTKGFLTLVVAHATFCIVRLSFDEIVVTTFTAGAGIETLPQWIFNNMFRPASLPVVNVVATVMVLISIVPVYLAQRVSDGVAGVTAGR